jgi:putative ABC transport system permease protein
MIHDLWYDIRHALRLLRRTPRNTAFAIAILALGIGTNTAMFSAINHVLLRPLPFPDADRLLRLRDQITGADGFPHPFNMSARNVLALREHASAFDAVVAMSGDSMTLLGGEVPTRLSVVLQSDGFDETLAVRPVLGRPFSADEQRGGLDGGVALVSHALWQTRLGGSPAAIGASIRLDNRTFTVVGVMPPLYAFPYDAQVWLPIVLDPADQTRDFAVWAHMRPRATKAEAQVSLATTAARIREQFPGTLPSYSIEMMTMRENVLGTQDAPLRALTTIVACLLLVACVNVSTLSLAHAVTRRREFAVRAALGATPARHVRQLLSESLVLGACGCASGLLLTAWLAPLTGRLIPSVLTEQLGLATLRTDWRVAAFAAIVSVASAIVAGVVPAFGSWRSDPRGALAEGGRAIGIGTGRRIFGVLIVAETALTLVLIAGAGLVVRNFVRLQTLALGFEAPGLLAMELTPPAERYRPGAARAALVRRIVDEVAGAPGVVRAAVTTVNPLGGGTWAAPVITENTAAFDANAAFNVNHRLISPGLFETMGIRLLRGRTFTEQDRAGAQMVVIVSDRMAQRLWPNVDPIGKRARIARPNRPWLTVVGVAGDVSDSHDPGVPLETWYVPYEQHADSAAAEHVYIMARSHGDAPALTSSIQQTIARVDRTLALYNPVAMDRYRADSISRERVSAGFMLGFAAFGLMLAALGVYGVMAFSITQRTAEFGVRMALGAGMKDILPLVLRRSAALVGIGLLVGTIAAVALNRVLASILTHVGPLDVTILAGAAMSIVATAGVACLVPAIAAARLDPVQALKAD